MATGILHIDMGHISFETGYGVPVHPNKIGSLFVDIVQPGLYQNQDGIIDWQLIGTGGSGGTGNISGFTTFDTGSGSVSANGPNETLTFSGINLNIITDDINKIITFSAGTGGGGGVSPSANTFVNSFTYNNANKLTITRNDAVSFEVNLDVFTGITVNGDLTVTGDTTLNNVTATTVSAQTISAGTFIGDGSGLSGVSTTDTFVTGFTYDNANNFTISRNDGTSFVVNVSVFTGITVNGNTTINGDLTVTGDTNLNTVTAVSISADTITANTITAGTFYGDGSGLSGVSGEDNYVFSGVYNTGTTSIDFSGTNSATTFSVDVSGLADLPIVDIDRVTGNVTLIGYGEFAACKIQRINTQGGGYTSTWAGGDDVTLNKNWGLRNTYIYS
jgi:hypothetical protein